MFSLYLPLRISFCRFSAGSKSKIKSSDQRKIRTKIQETYPLLEPVIDEIIPKKEQLDATKLIKGMQLYSLGKQPLFWQHIDGTLIPHLRLVHRYPTCFHRLRIDRGAIRFVLSGATLMVPGLVSSGGRLPGAKDALDEDSRPRYGTEDLEAGTVVVVEAEGKEHACLVGQLKMGTKDMKSEQKGVAIDSGHYIGDALWKISFE